MVSKKKKVPSISVLERISNALTEWVGTPGSILVHTLFFIFMFILPFFGIPFDKVLLILTTVVSLEAIYLAIFIQMTVNKHTESLEDVGEDIEDIQEDVEDIQEDVDEMQEDVEDIQENLDIDEDDKRELSSLSSKKLTDSQTIHALIKEIKSLREEIKKSHKLHKS